jgi:hypothetical protein
MLASCLLACAVPATVMQGCAHKTYGDPAVPVAGEVLGTVIHTSDPEELRYVVLKELTERFADEQGIVVTREENEAYIRHVRDALRADRQRQMARRDELTRRLESASHAEAERRTLAAELETVNQFIAALGEPEPATRVDPEEARARQEIAAAFIRQWKINRALCRKCGGRIVFQQGGPEPLDAYRLFLEQSQVRGDLAIVNKDLEAAFWCHCRDDSIQSFYRSGSKEEAQAFDVAPWQPAGAGGGPR